MHSQPLSPIDIPRTYNLCISSLILFGYGKFIRRFYDELPAAIELINDGSTFKDLKLLLRIIVKCLKTLRRLAFAPIENVFEDVLRSLDEI